MDEIIIFEGNPLREIIEILEKGLTKRGDFDIMIKGLGKYEGKAYRIKDMIRIDLKKY